MFDANAVGAAKFEARILHCFVPRNELFRITDGAKHFLFSFFKRSPGCTLEQRDSTSLLFTVLGFSDSRVSSGLLLEAETVQRGCDFN